MLRDRGESRERLGGGRRRFVILAVLAIPCITYAATLEVPNTFISGTPAVADEVNANFVAVEAAVNDNAVRLDNLKIPVVAGPPDPQLCTAPEDVGVVVIADGGGLGDDAFCVCLDGVALGFVNVSGTGSCN